MTNHRIRRLAAGLMLLSGVTHVAQLFVYPSEYHVIGAATFGGIYFLIGLFLLGQRRAPLWFGAILPAIGGVLGIIRFINLHRNPFSVFHVLIDLIVVPACIYLLTRKSSVVG